MNAQSDLERIRRVADEAKAIAEQARRQLAIAGGLPRNRTEALLECYEALILVVVALRNEAADARAEVGRLHMRLDAEREQVERLKYHNDQLGRALDAARDKIEAQAE